MKAKPVPGTTDSWPSGVPWTLCSETPWALALKAQGLLWGW